MRGGQTETEHAAPMPSRAISSTLLLYLGMLLFPGTEVSTSSCAHDRNLHIRPCALCEPCDFTNIAMASSVSQCVNGHSDTKSLTDVVTSKPVRMQHNLLCCIFSVAQRSLLWLYTCVVILDKMTR